MSSRYSHAGAASSASGFVPNAAGFDGATWLNRGGNLTGVVKGRTGSSVFWAKLLGGDGANRSVVMTGPIGSFQLNRDNINQYTVRGFTEPSVGSILNIGTSATHLADGFWHCIMMSWDVTNQLSHVFVDDVSDQRTPIWSQDADIGYTGPGEFYIGARETSVPQFIGDMSEVWFAFNKFIPWDIIANRRLFIDENLSPVPLGDNGELPLEALGFTGEFPDIYNGRTPAWETNLGTGGGFTENGNGLSSVTGPQKAGES